MIPPPCPTRHFWAQTGRMVTGFRNDRSSGTLMHGWLQHPCPGKCCFGSVILFHAFSNEGMKLPGMTQPESRETLPVLLGKQLKGAALYMEGQAGRRTLNQHFCSCSLKSGALSSKDGLGPTHPSRAGAHSWPGTPFELQLSQEAQGCPRYCRTVIFQAQTGRGATINHSHCPFPPCFSPFGFFPRIIPHPTDPGSPAESLALQEGLVCAAASPELFVGGMGQRSL